MRIDLKNVAVKVERKHPHDCIISIGRLSSVEKEILLSMFPTAIHSLKYRRHESTSGTYQMTINVSIPNDFDFKVFNSDLCNLSITDCLLTSQLISLETVAAQPNWFDCDDSESANDDITSKEETNMEPQIVCLSYVSVKVSPSSKTITIGRIGESEKWRIGQVFPSNMLHWKSRKILDVNFYELTLKYNDAVSDLGDSNECTLTISYDQTDSVCILKQVRTPRDNIQTLFGLKKEKTNMKTATLEKCNINDNATIMFWSDGTKTVTKTTPGDAFDPEIGIAIGIAKKLFGSKHKFDKYVNEVVSDTYQRTVKEFTERELLDALAENEKITTKAKEKHKAEKEAYIAAKNDPNHKGKLPELHSLKGGHSYRFAKIRKDIIMAEIEKRKAKKATKAKAKTRARKKKPETKK